MQQMLKNTLSTLLSLMLLSTLTHCASGDGGKAKEAADSTTPKDTPQTPQTQPGIPPGDQEKLTIDAKGSEGPGDDLQLSITNTGKAPADLTQYELKVEADKKITYNGNDAKDHTVVLNTLLGQSTLAKSDGAKAIHGQFTLKPGTDTSVDITYTLTNIKTSKAVATQKVTWNNPTVSSAPAIAITIESFTQKKEDQKGSPSYAQTLTVDIKNNSVGPIQFSDYAPTATVQVTGSAGDLTGNITGQSLAKGTSMTITLKRDHEDELDENGTHTFTFTLKKKGATDNTGAITARVTSPLS